MNLGSVFVGKNETFWGVYDFIEETMMVVLVELNDKQLNDCSMRTKKNFQTIEVELKEFSGKNFMLVPNANYR